MIRKISGYPSVDNRDPVQQVNVNEIIHNNIVKDPLRCEEEFSLRKENLFIYLIEEFRKHQFANRARINIAPMTGRARKCKAKPVSTS